MAGFQSWPEYSAPADWLESNVGHSILPELLEAPLMEEAPPMEEAQDISPTKKVKLAAKCESSAMTTKSMRLPAPCPCPSMFTDDVTQAIESKIIGIMKLRMQRQAATYYWGICPWQKTTEYNTMAKAMCNKYPQLRSKSAEYWVRD